MREILTVYVRLLDEGIDVWRPVKAEYLHDGIYRIVPQEHDQDIETWQFAPGDLVTCKPLNIDDGTILAAIQKTELRRRE